MNAWEIRAGVLFVGGCKHFQKVLTLGTMQPDVVFHRVEKWYFFYIMYEFYYEPSVQQ